MSYFIRLLSPTEDVPTVGEIERALQSEGFAVQLTAAPEAAAWQSLELRVPDQPPVAVARHRRRGDENPVEVEVDSFLDLLLDHEETPGVRAVEAALRRARQMLVLQVPDAFPWGAERTVVDALVEFLADHTEALIQADGEGFYDREGNLLIAVE